MAELIMIYPLVGLLAGIWSVRRFLRQLDAKYGGARSKLSDDWPILIVWAIAWPVLLPLDGWLNRKVLDRSRGDRHG